jgi:putative tryptophan/tyrosine transport system substrate-binding protein
VEAASRATSTIPIVFVTAANPVASGYVESLARPGGNLTGPSQLAPGLTGKRLEILREIDPRIARVGVFWDPGNRNSAGQWQETRGAAAALGVQLLSLEAREPGDFAAAFALALGGGADALFLPIAQAIMVQLPLIAEFALAHRLPSMAFQREFPDAGGLTSYGASIPALYRRAAYYVDRILKGASPAELPVEQPTAFDLIVNLRSAAALGLVIPPSVLQQATEVIQ